MTGVIEGEGVETVGEGMLVVCLDDDPVLEPVFLAAARRAGVRGLFALDLARFQDSVRTLRPALVLLDQVMPEVTGAEVIQWLRGLEAPPRVIVIGANPLYLETGAALVRGSGLQLAGTLRKPFRVDELARELREAAAPRG